MSALLAGASLLGVAACTSAERGAAAAAVPAAGPAAEPRDLPAAAPGPSPTSAAATSAAPRPPAGTPDATAVCIQFAQTAATLDTTSTTLGQVRETAARDYGTARLHALYDGPGEGRNPEQDTWRRHQARVAASATPVAAEAHDEPDEHLTAQLHPGTLVAMVVTGTARGADGWTAPIAAYRLDCLTVQDPVAGWLVDDIAVTALLAEPSVG